VYYFFAKDAMELLQEKRKQVLAVAAKHGASNVRVFGSVVRGEDTPESDIDFLIDYDPEQVMPWFPGGADGFTGLAGAKGGCPDGTGH
jgi:hypothetical protein